VKLAASLSNEKDLPTSQPPTQTNSWIPGADGHAGRTQGAQAPPREGPLAPGNLDTAQAAGLTSVRAQLSFAAADRLHRSAEFIRLQRHGARFQSPHFVLYADNLDGEPAHSRLGVTVSRRIGNAVARNRVKRRVREFFRKEMRAQLPVGTSVVVIARAGAATLESPAISNELTMAARNLSGRMAAKGARRN